MPRTRLVGGRSTFGGALSGVLMLSLSGLADATPEQVGRQADGTVIVSTNQTLSAAGRQVEFRGRPMAVTLSPDGQTAAVLNATYKAIILIDVATGTVKQEFDLVGASASFAGLLYAPSGDKLYASQSTGGILIANVASDGTLSLDAVVGGLPLSKASFPGREDGDSYPGGMALSEDGRTLYIALNRNNALGVFDLASRTITSQIPVGNAPHDVVVMGGKAYVSNQGGKVASPSDFTMNSSGTPIVASSRGYASTGTVSVVDLARGITVKTLEVGLSPTALLAAGQPRVRSQFGERHGFGDQPRLGSGGANHRARAVSAGSAG